ncbi:hypothetical protein QAD02_007438 [Eretmocerus hayati]|uniref:Uncharacterized protein n=1 Tax=Eretmocerus hayati TaxID=131215 RepID=A0ACC2N4F8_9HYME|nr:hypothetical protein QAD02_007438 [Eretmocerus hayati]
MEEIVVVWLGNKQKFALVRENSVTPQGTSRMSSVLDNNHDDKCASASPVPIPTRDAETILGASPKFLQQLATIAVGSQPPATHRKLSPCPPSPMLKEITNKNGREGACGVQVGDKTCIAAAVHGAPDTRQPTTHSRQQQQKRSERKIAVQFEAEEQHTYTRMQQWTRAWPIHRGFRAYH